MNAPLKVSGLKVLIVDDSLIIRRTIQRQLDENAVSEVAMASNGVEALQLFRQQEPDIVTLDITMPKMDGLTCVEEMLRINSEARILVISALADKRTALDALKRGAQAFLCKPFTPDELREVFQELLEP